MRNWRLLIPLRVWQATQCDAMHPVDARQLDGGIPIGKRAMCVRRRWHRGWHQDYWKVQWPDA